MLPTVGSNSWVSTGGCRLGFTSQASPLSRSRAALVNLRRGSRDAIKADLNRPAGSVTKQDVGPPETQRGQLGWPRGLWFLV